jgi:serine protease Do
MASLLRVAPARGRLALVGSLVLVGALLITSRGAAHRVAPSFRDVVARTGSGLVRIETMSCGRELLGSGFLIDSRHVATAAHVVDGATRIDLKQGGHRIGEGTIVGADAARDVALVKTDAPIHGYVFSLSNRQARMGDDVAALGFPLGRKLAVARGFVRGTAHTVPAGLRLVQTDAALQHGDSGGPLLSVTDGAVLGIVNLSSASSGGPSFAVGARDFAPLLSRWRRDPEAVPQRPCRARGGPALG